jgi:hypothetical protein
MQDEDSLRDEQIRTLAYLKWEQAGRPDGRSDEFWLAAEQEIVDAEWQEYHRQRWEQYEQYEATAEPDKTLWKVVLSAIKDCIYHHGPIDFSLVASAAKRVIGGIIEDERFRQVCSEDLHNKLIVGTLEHYYKIKLWEWQQRYEKVVRKLKDKNGGITPEKRLKATLATKGKDLEAQVKKKEKENLELHRQIAYWRVLAEGPPKQVLPMPPVPTIISINGKEDPTLTEMNGTVKFLPRYLESINGDGLRAGSQNDGQQVLLPNGAEGHPGVEPFTRFSAVKAPTS